MLPQRDKQSLKQLSVTLLGSGGTTTKTRNRSQLHHLNSMPCLSVWVHPTRHNRPFTLCPSQCLLLLLPLLLAAPAPPLLLVAAAGLSWPLLFSCCFLGLVLAAPFLPSTASGAGQTGSGVRLTTLDTVGRPVERQQGDAHNTHAQEGQYASSHGACCACALPTSPAALLCEFVRPGKALTAIHACLLTSVCLKLEIKCNGNDAAAAAT